MLLFPRNPQIPEPNEPTKPQYSRNQTLFPSTATPAPINCVPTVATVAGKTNHGSDCPGPSGSLHCHITHPDREQRFRIPDQERRRLAAGTAKEEAKTEQTYLILFRVCGKENEGQSINFP